MIPSISAIFRTCRPPGDMPFTWRHFFDKMLSFAKLPVSASICASERHTPSRLPGAAEGHPAQRRSEAERGPNCPKLLRLTEFCKALMTRSFAMLPKLRSSRPEAVWPSRPKVISGRSEHVRTVIQAQFEHRLAEEKRVSANAWGSDRKPSGMLRALSQARNIKTYMRPRGIAAEQAAQLRSQCAETAELSSLLATARGWALRRPCTRPTGTM